MYGTTWSGGASASGTIFAIKTNGTGFTNLYSFTGSADGANPEDELILSGNTIYGTANGGGIGNNGTIFSLTFPSPQLSIFSVGTNVILTWPSGVPGFDYSSFALQSATNLMPPVAWSAVAPLPVLVNGLNTVTNPLAGTQQFYRLSQ